MTDFSLSDLAQLIAARAMESGGSSYTASLLEAGAARCAKKFGEEAVELVIAAVEQDRKAIILEAADVLYHLLVVLQRSAVSLQDVEAELGRRTAQSGLSEKAGRKTQA